MRKQKPYSRIPTPALPGSGSRDRTAIRHISAGLRQHPLDCEDILSRLSFFVNPSAYLRGICVYSTPVCPSGIGGFSIRMCPFYRSGFPAVSRRRTPAGKIPENLSYPQLLFEAGFQVHCWKYSVPGIPGFRSCMVLPASQCSYAPVHRSFHWYSHTIPHLQPVRSPHRSPDLHK